MVSRQLSPLDTATVIKQLYHVGDRVMVRKKPMAASYIKRGDIVEIAGVHPRDHSIKFWNKRSERWEYLHPDEIGRVVTQKDDSPTIAEVAVGESFCPLSETDTVPSVDAAIKSNRPHSKIDSPTIAEVAPGKSIAQDDSPTMAEVAVGESIAPGKSIAQDDSPTMAEVAVDDDYLELKPISTYQPRGTARGGKYFRLSYREGNKVRQVHIRGGNTDSPIAQAKVQEVRSLLASGVSPAEIARWLRDSSSSV
jgi:hypothetical protein